MEKKERNINWGRNGGRGRWDNIKRITVFHRRLHVLTDQDDERIKLCLARRVEPCDSETLTAQLMNQT
jgi:hypothetical protein